MKVIAYTALHYGREYLSWAMRSVEEHVDEFHIIYTDRPSYGHDTELANPEPEEVLRMVATAGRKKPVHWHTGRWNGEGVHRETILPIAEAAKADLILWLDYDEVWDPATLRKCLDEAYARPEREFRVKFIHFWKSFHWACTDPCMPVRIINPKGNGTWYIHNPVPVLHFGYALDPATVFYKQAIHGHKGEWKPNWFEEVYLKWKPGQEDVHPTCGRNERNEAFWVPKPTPPEVKRVLMDQMFDHPYMGSEIIG